jgi:hypothetical protein
MLENDNPTYIEYHEWVKSQGGDAFPMSSPVASYHGMTLRDYFAGQALHAMLAVGSIGERVTIDPPAIAHAMYSIADAMLEQRRMGNESKSK